MMLLDNSYMRQKPEKGGFTSPSGIMQRHRLIVAKALLRIPPPLKTREVFELCRRVPRRWTLIPVSEVDIDREVCETACVLHRGSCIFEKEVDRVVKRCVGVIVALHSSGVTPLAHLRATLASLSNSVNSHL